MTTTATRRLAPDLWERSNLTPLRTRRATRTARPSLHTTQVTNPRHNPSSVRNATCNLSMHLYMSFFPFAINIFRIYILLPLERYYKKFNNILLEWIGIYPPYLTHILWSIYIFSQFKLDTSNIFNNISILILVYR